MVDIDKDRHGNIWIGGNDGRLCAIVYKISSSGEVIWKQQLCPPDTTRYHKIVGVKSRRDGGVWCVVASNNFKTSICHLDEQGNMLWSGTIPDQYFLMGFDSRWSMTLDSLDNCYLLELETWGWYNYSPHKAELLMIEANTHTVHQSSIHIPIPPTGQRRGLLQDTDGPPVLYINYQNGYNEYQRITYLIGLSSDRNFQWAKRYDNLPVNQLQARFSNNDIMAAGGTRSGYYLFRFTPTGTLIRLKKAVIDQPNSYFDGYTELSADKKSIWLYGSVADAPILSLKRWGNMLYRLDTNFMPLSDNRIFSCRETSATRGIATNDGGFLVANRGAYYSLLSQTTGEGHLNTGCAEMPAIPINWVDVPIPEGKDTVFTVEESIINLQPVTDQWQNIEGVIYDFCSGLPDFASSFELPEQLCANEKLYIHATHTPLDSIRHYYRWLSPGSTMDAGYEREYLIQYPMPGIYPIHLIQSYGTCVDDTITKLIHVTGDISYIPQYIDTLLCPGQTMSIDVSAPDALGYIWNDGATDPVRVWDSSGQWSVKVIGNECSISDTFSVRYFDLPVLWAAADTTLCTDTDIPAPAVPQVAVWEWNGIPASPPFAVDSAGIYSLTALFSHGCTASDTVHIALVDCDTLPRLYVPNIFTPASGDANSVFSVFFNPQVTHLWTHIYDRWGTMVYRAEGAEPPRWDGTMNGKLMPPGVYAVVTALRPAGEAEQVLRRTVTLVR